MITDGLDLDAVMKKPDDIIIDEWRYNDFEIRKEYEVTLLKFPKRETKKVNKNMIYYIFNGIVIQNNCKIHCNKIFFSKQNFDHNFLQNKNRGKLIPGKDLKINIIRLSQKKLSIISMENL